MNISSHKPVRHHIPQVNNYRMGVQESFLGQVEYPIDSREEHRAQTTFQSVKTQHNALASHLTSLDNTYQDRDPRPGEVSRQYQGYENGTGNYLDERVDFSYSTTTGAPLNLNAQGEYYTALGTIDLEKQVGWDSHGQTAFQDTRRHKDTFGIPIGSESVRGFEFTAGPDEPSGLNYEQKRRGWLLP